MADRDTSDAVPMTSTLKASALDPQHKSMARATREAVIAELRDELPQGPPKQRRLGEHADED